MKTGTIEWHLVSDGTFLLDGGAMFGVVPKPLWSMRAPADDRNRITLGVHPLLIRAGGKTVLVDAGIGRKEKGRFPDLYGVGDETDIVTSLAGHGISPEDVDIVVFTHLHFDHAGGATRLDEEGRVVPVFPNARHLVERNELFDAENPTVRSRASYISDNWAPLENAGLLEVVEGDLEIVPGVTRRVMKGHVRALVGVLLDSDGERAFYPTDNMPTAAHVPPPWVMGFDLYPLDTVAFKESFLPQAADEEWTVIFEHDPDIGAARIQRKDKGWEIEPVLDAPPRARSPEAPAGSGRKMDPRGSAVE
jgi:glyoxylase-like metal-dependent hydrolase (beta-lactamase superfamily II)